MWNQAITLTCKLRAQSVRQHLERVQSDSFLDDFGSPTAILVPLLPQVYRELYYMYT